MISLYDGKANLQYARERLELQWRAACEHWQDAVAQQFEREHLEPLDPKIRSALQAIERLAEVLRRAELECSEQRGTI